MDEREAPKTSIHSLPVEILMHIFGYLGCKEKATAARVCKAWRDTAYSRPLWQTQNVRINLDAMCSFRYGSLAERGVQRVVILSCERPQAISHLAASLSSLSHLDLRPNGFLSESFVRTAFHADIPQLRVLKLKISSLDCLSVLTCVMEKLPALEELTLEGDLLNSTLTTFSSQFRNLKRLKLVSRGLTDAGVACLGGVSKDETPSSEQADIQHLALCGSSMLTDKTLQLLSQGFPNLVTLKLTDCMRITQQGLLSLAGLPRLRNLTLARGSIRDEDLQQLGEVCRGLVSLNLDLHPGLGDGLVQSLASLTSLSYLSLRGVILSEAAILGLVASLPRLRKLALCPISPDIRDRVNNSRPGSLIVPKLRSR